MNKEKVNTWLNALLSGEYKQGLGVLYDVDNDSYCCLGVADKVVFGEDFDDDGKDSLGYYVNLHPKRSEILGLTNKLTAEEASRIIDMGFPTTIIHSTRAGLLAEMNDGGATFTQIVNVIKTLGWDGE